MPLYEYHCSTCNINETRFRSISAMDAYTECQKCGKPMQRIKTPQGDVKTDRVSDVLRKV